jgi:hypothetical protein
MPVCESVLVRELCLVIVTALVLIRELLVSVALGLSMV